MLADNACSSDGDTSEDLCDVAVDTRFDAGGQALQQTVPYALPANPAAPWRGQDLQRPSNFTVYDVLGRPRQATAPDSAPTTWSYTTSGASAPDGYRYTETCQTNALGGTTCTRADLLGRVRKAIPPSGPAVAYSYDMEDQLLQVQRGGVTTSLSYDLGGRKLQMNDPDMGVWNYAYDALGNLTRQADARGQRICLYYDGLNRLTGKQYRTDDACPSSPTLNVTYTYDSGTYAKGYRTGMVDPSGSTSWTYDPRGRVVDETKTVTGVGSFRSAWSYNSADLLASQSFPVDA